MNNEPVVVYQAKNSVEASCMLLLLADVGIHGRMASSALEAVSGEVPFQTISIPILVSGSDRELALQEIQRHQKQTGHDKR